MFLLDVTFKCFFCLYMLDAACHTHWLASWLKIQIIRADTISRLVVIYLSVVLMYVFERSVAVKKTVEMIIRNWQSWQPWSYLPNKRFATNRKILTVFVQNSLLQQHLIISLDDPLMCYFYILDIFVAY